MKKKSTILFLPALCLLLFAVSAQAQKALTVDIYGPGQRLVNMTMLPPRSLREGAPVPAAAQEFESLVRNNFSYIPFLKDIPMSSLLGGNPSKGVKGSQVDFKPLQLAKVDLVMTTGWDGSNLEVRVFETFSGRMVVGKAYGQVAGNAAIIRVADRFSSVLLQELCGKKGFFESPIAFVKQLGKSKEIYTVLPQGRDLTRITKLGGFNLSPTWSPNGDKLVFTHIGATKHSLGVWNSATGKVGLTNKGLGQSVISPVFLDQKRVAVTLNKTGHSDIYLLDEGFKPIRTLVKSSYIDVSPSFDRTGTQMAFTSGRAGNPHVYVLNLKTGKLQRVTINGRYNTHPCLSPDGKYIAYTHLTSEGHRIFLHDMRTGRETQLSFGPGNDEYPAFGPDGYFIAFASDRSGEYKLYLTTRHGDTPKILQTGAGAAFAPAWDTSLQR
ncbi:DPP IV N-terminal domain-containing protein [Pseudodesulfovibrio senegalensis]|uniref:Protein tolB n=1 Tax=Pseudodesulfovibrio senegalensis TaxID=1721087 RepID=A0A6N6N8W5_9BACT|nr:DPP IV N-terminal domain-containing protein [Pseudodesulfovibrio senegalensis]KAB1443705.1 protein tolB [Pseudodesulfovibrio senegalensis]